MLLQMHQHLRVVLVDIDHRRGRHNGFDIRQLCSHSSHWRQAIIVIIDGAKPTILPIVIRTLLVVIKQDGVVDVVVVFIISCGVVLRDRVGVNYRVLMLWIGRMVLIGE